ncbi:MAG: 50S ribosomal protein L11 methyltransferase [Thermodesulfatator sp.]|nr:MAG: 50S ribosomal protein L11 methyltransferase [Thermodesulfatator sp.]
MIRDSKEGKHPQYWIELQVETSQDLSEAVIDFLVSELHRGVIVEEKPETEGSVSHPVLIKAYLNQEDLESGVLKGIETYFSELLELHSDYPRIIWGTQQIVEEDWSQGWKKYFKPVKIGTRLVIKPTWEVYVPDEGEIVIEIDPGQAFGVGTHASTRLMLQELEAMGRQVLEGSSVLDIGTGTGVLAITAAKLGSRDVMAIDIDQDAVETARKNVHLNNVHNVVTVSTTPVWEVEGPFDVVLANLDRDTILFLAREIARLVSTKGTLVVSGILEGQEQVISNSFAEKGLKLASSKKDSIEQEWVVLRFLNNS